MVACAFAAGKGLAFSLPAHALQHRNFAAKRGLAGQRLQQRRSLAEPLGVLPPGTAVAMAAPVGSRQRVSERMAELKQQGR